MENLTIMQRIARMYLVRYLERKCGPTFTESAVKDILDRDNIKNNLRSYDEMLDEVTCKISQCDDEMCSIIVRNMQEEENDYLAAKIKQESIPFYDRLRGERE